MTRMPRWRLSATFSAACCQRLLPLLRGWVGHGACCGSVLLHAQDFGPQDCLVQAELAVELMDSVWFSHHVDDGVNALGLLVNLIGEAPSAPDVDLVDAAAPGGDHIQQLLQRWLDSAFLEIGVEDDHHLVVAHEKNLPPLDWRGHGLSVTGGAAHDDT